MLQTLEAMIDNQGRLKFYEPVSLQDNQRVLVTFLKDTPPALVESDYAHLMRRLAYVKVGRRFSRDELNER